MAVREAVEVLRVYLTGLIDLDEAVPLLNRYCPNVSWGTILAMLTELLHRS